jgi:hypothetical protein
MATIIKSVVESLGGVSYDIYVDNGAPTVAGTTLLTKSASVDYKPNTQDVDACLLTSKASVTFIVRDQSERDLFTPLIEAQELQYRLRIHRNDSLWWVGFVLLNFVEEDFGQYPYSITLGATDGISRLKEIDYDQGDSEDFIPVGDHIFKILEQVPLSDYYTANEEYARFHSTLFPEGLTPSASLDLHQSVRASFKALRTVDERGIVKFKTCYEALISLLENVGARLMYAQGRYVISEIEDYARQGSAVVFHPYKIDGTALTVVSLANWESQIVRIGANLQDEDAVALANGKITRLPPLLGVDLTYKHYSRQNLLPGYIWTQDFQPSAELVNFRGNGGAGRLLLTAGIEFLITPSGTPREVAGAIYLVIGINVDIRDSGGTSISSLSRSAIITQSGVSYSEAEWTTGNRVYEIAIPAPPPQAQRPIYQPFSLTTPIIPDEGTLVLDLSIVRYVDGNNDAITDVNIDYSISNVFLESLLTGSITDQYNYTDFNPSTGAEGANSIILEREHLFGDGPDENTFGRLEFFDGTEWLRTDGWRRWAGGAYLNTEVMPIGGLLSQMTLALQSEQRERLDITVVAHTYQPDFLFRCGSNAYIMQKAGLNLSSDRWRGTWFEIASNFIDVAPPSTGTNVPPVGDTGVDSGGAPDLPGTNTGGIIGPSGTGATPGLSAPGINTILSATDDGIAPDVEIGGLTVPSLTDTPLFAGDIITIINPITGETQNVEVSHDSGFIPGLQSDAGAVEYFGADGVEWLVPSTTEVAIVLVTPTTSFPEGSYLQPDPQFTAQLQELLRKDYYDFHLFGFDDSLTTGFVGAFWRPNRRIGWHIRKVHFAFAQDMTGSAKVNLKYYDSTGYRYTVATYNGGGLGGVIDAFADVLEGYYRVEIETTTGTAPKGLTVTPELIKINT